MQYNLEERTILFGERTLIVLGKIKRSVITLPLIDQLVRSSTSIGANYMEANGAASRKDFMNKIYICKKEAMETKYWLKILIKIVPEAQSELEQLLQEARELTLIFSKINGTLRHSTLNKN